MKPRIVFVDDEPHVLDALRRALHAQQETWSMSYASGAREAIGLLRGAGADTVVTDVMMPEMDGFELLEQLQAADETKDIPVLVVTGSHDHDLKRRALDLGAADLLAKPVDRQELLARLRSVLRLKACHDEIRSHNAQLHQKVAERTAELAGAHVDMIWRLAKLAESRDEDTGNHVVRVSYYCRAIAESLGLDRSFIERVFLASPLHDIGKVAVPDRILRKPGKLTADEWQIMQQHCAFGAEILRQEVAGPSRLDAWASSCCRCVGSANNPSLQTAASIALTHHEWWDGAGYPQRLAGEQIPLESRIVAVADSYDALCSFRPYKPAFPHEQSIALMTQEVGRHFDPTVFAAFLNAGETLRGIRAEFADSDVPLDREAC